jgi:transposase
VNSLHYIGLDAHKKTISYCLRQADGTILWGRAIAATREALASLREPLPQPWVAGLEATMFTAWIYDHLREHGGTVKVAHSAMLLAIAAGKKRTTASTHGRSRTCFDVTTLVPRELRDGAVCCVFGTF